MTVEACRYVTAANTGHGWCFTTFLVVVMSAVLPGGLARFQQQQQSMHDWHIQAISQEQQVVMDSLPCALVTGLTRMHHCRRKLALARFVNTFSLEAGNSCWLGEQM